METAQSTELLQPRIPFLVWAAIFVSFFPCGILYPLQYPVREVATLLIWICAFPSRAGKLSLLLLPLLPNDTYGYFAFNLFCVMSTFGTGLRVIQWSKANGSLAPRLHRMARAYMVISLLLAVWQALDGRDWLNAFPAMFGIGGGRGAGFRPEPSLLAPILALYLMFVIWRRTQPDLEDGERKRLFFEVGAISLATLILTRSFSVAIIVICVLPAFTGKFRYFLGTLTAGSLLAGVVFWDRIQNAFTDAAGSFADLITTAVGSWRNVPDILVLVNYPEYLFPSSPANMRDKLNLSAILWNPVFAWLDNTYSTFSASATTIGLLATGALFAGGMYLGLRRISRANGIGTTWILLYVADWFVLPKYEPCGWVALGVLTAATWAVEEGAAEFLPAAA